VNGSVGGSEASGIPSSALLIRISVLAISAAEPENVPGGGCVESVVTPRTHFRFASRVSSRLKVSIWLSDSTLRFRQRVAMFLRGQIP
jgi:hypothetical protein